MRENNFNIPPIVAEYITAMFNEKNPNIRKNYRDNIEQIKNACEQALKTFDKNETTNRISAANSPRRNTIRAAYAQ